MKPHRQDIVWDFIRTHGLHRPFQHVADIGLLKPQFRPELVAADFPYAAVSRHPGGGVVSERTPMRILLRRNLSVMHMRLAYVHEVMHHVLGHEGALPLLNVGPWFHDRNEREAWQAAAMVLIPTDSFFASPHIRWLMKVSNVPDWLITEYPLATQLLDLGRRDRPAIFR